ncbi:MAG: hypothetical protein IPM29_13580 [Planctomycetes bacterium]|nr:hypothetical protein [Planctomycetota bacterium]
MNNNLLSRALCQAVEALRGGAGEDTWTDVERALRRARPDDPDLADSDLAVIVELRDFDELARLVDGWRDPKGDLPIADKAIIDRAMKALRKRIKLARLDEESSLGGSALTGGKHSAITAVRPPEQYPAEVWELLIARGRVRDIGHGLLEPVGAG